jgi:hypothetical protein
MAIDRREMLAGLLVALSAGKVSRAEAMPNRLFISCRMDQAANASVACFDAEGREVFATMLPARGHDVALQPAGRHAVVFARRPGTWFAVLERTGGGISAMVHAAEDRHFFGHGTYSGDGRLLYATENDIATGAGLIGIYDASDGYRRLGEMSSGGIGPHDLALFPGGDRLVIANGGLRTHPATGREILNPDDMQPNLVLLDLRDGAILARHELGSGLRKLSIRHLAVRKDGMVAFGCQYQGSEEDAPPLIGLLPAHGVPRLLAIDEDRLFRMKNYVGSVAFDDSGRYLVGTSPHGGAALVWDMTAGAVARDVPLSDVCGVAPMGKASFLLTSGNAGLAVLGEAGLSASSWAQRWIWDNHARALFRP